MLPIHFNTGEDVRNRDVQDLFRLGVPDNRRVGDCAFDAIALHRWTVTANYDRDLGAALERLLHDALMVQPSFPAERPQVQNIPQALNNRRLACATAAHQHIKIRIEPASNAIQKTTFPTYLNELVMFVRFRGSEADTRPWV